MRKYNWKYLFLAVVLAASVILREFFQRVDPDVVLSKRVAEFVRRSQMRIDMPEPLFLNPIVRNILYFVESKRGDLNNVIFSLEGSGKTVAFAAALYDAKNIVYIDFEEDIPLNESLFKAFGIFEEDLSSNFERMALSYKDKEEMTLKRFLKILDLATIQICEEGGSVPVLITEHTERLFKKKRSFDMKDEGSLFLDGIHELQRKKQLGLLHITSDRVHGYLLNGLPNIIMDSSSYHPTLEIEEVYRKLYRLHLQEGIPKEIIDRMIRYYKNPGIIDRLLKAFNGGGVKEFFETQRILQTKIYEDEIRATMYFANQAGNPTQHIIMLVKLLFRMLEFRDEVHIDAVRARLAIESVEEQIETIISNIGIFKLENNKISYKDEYGKDALSNVLPEVFLEKRSTSVHQILI